MHGYELWKLQFEIDVLVSQSLGQLGPAREKLHSSAFIPLYEIAQTPCFKAFQKFSPFAGWFQGVASGLVKSGFWRAPGPLWLPKGGAARSYGSIPPRKSLPSSAISL